MTAAAECFNPYPGLRSFRLEEDYLFFGREEQVEELMRRLRTTRFLAVLGPSGSGKSSLIRAGLIPALYGGGMVNSSSSWRVAVLRPGYDPIRNLARSLLSPLQCGDCKVRQEMDGALLEASLRRSSLGLLESVHQAHLPEDHNLLVVVDQFEELFRSTRAGSPLRDEGLAFAKLLLEVPRHLERPVHVVVAMRSDFIGQCAEIPGLPGAINLGLYLVPRLSREQLRAAVVGPAAVGGGKIAGRAVQQLLADVGDDQDQLPILQHALARTWDHWLRHGEPGSPIDLPDYEAIGTMRTALARHAEEAYWGLTPEERRIAEILFKALTEVDAEGREFRRPLTLATGCALTGADEDQVKAVVDWFRAPGRSFLTPTWGTELTPDSVIDITHESLIRVWSRLRSWVGEEQRSAQMYLRLVRADRRHARGSGSLLRDPELQLALNWLQEARPTQKWAERYDPELEQTLQFLERSREARDRAAASREAGRRRQLRQAQVLALVLGLAALVTLIFGILTLAARNRADAYAHEAEQQHRAAERHRLLGEDRLRLAQRQRALAEEQRRRAEDQRKLAEHEQQRALAAERAALELRATAEEARSRAEAHQSEAQIQQQLADEARQRAERSEEESQRLRLVEIARSVALKARALRGEEQRELAGLLAVQAYRLYESAHRGLPDSDIFQALWWGLSRLGADANLVSQHTESVRGIALARAGERLASGSDDGRVRVFELWREGWPHNDLVGEAGGVRSMAFDRAGESLAVGDIAGSIRIWSSGRWSVRPQTLAAHQGSVQSLAFDPSGRTLASGGTDGDLVLWHRAEGVWRQSPPGRLPLEVRYLDFRPDGRRLALTTADGRVLLIDPRRPETPAVKLAALDEELTSIAYGGHGGSLAVGTRSGRVLLWDRPEPGHSPRVLRGHASPVTALAFSPSGQLLASVSLDRTALLWPLQEPGASPILLDQHDAWLWDVEFSADGDTLFTGGSDGALRAWPVSPETLVARLCRRLSRGLTADEWSSYLPADLSHEAGCPRPPAAGTGIGQEGRG